MPHDVALRGRRVLLEPLRVEHAEALAAAISPEDDVWTWMAVAPRSPEEMRAWIRARQTPAHGLRNLPFLQRDAATGAAMGSTSVFDLDEAARSAEIGHTWLAAPWRRTGANTEAKLLLLAHCFGTLDLQRVQIVTDERNARSRAAIERIGAKHEGILRNWRRGREGGLRNSAIYSFVAAEWPDARKRLEGLLG